MNARDKYREALEAYDKRRPKTTITTRTGAVFVMMKMDSVEVVKVFALLGIPMQELKSQADNMGGKLLDHMDEIMDQVVCPLSVDPRLLPSGTKTDCEDQLGVDELRPVDKADIINKLLAQSQGQEGRDLGESFRGDPARPPGRPAGT